MSDTFLELLRIHFGYSEFHGFQHQVIQHLANGRHALIVAPTGSGKSLCFQIPALATHDATALTVVLSPLIALMKDQVDALRKRNIDATCIHSLLPSGARQTRYEELEGGKYRLLYVTPERFRKASFLQSIRNRHVQLLAVDEAHCVSEWGHDFRPDYSRLREIREHLGNPTTLFLTATATSDVRQDIVSQMGLDGSEVTLFSEGIDRPNLSLDVTNVWDEDEKIEHIARLIRDWQGNGSGIVYVTLIKTLERMSEALLQLGISHNTYHGSLSANERRRMQEDFMNGNSPVVLATGAFGMGIDKEDIRFVIHAETPASIEAYYQEVGRAGRDGQPSQCVWLYDQQDLMTQMQFISWRNPDVDFFVRTHQFLTDQNEKCRSFGLDWLNERLQRVSRHDHRLDTALGLMDRHGVVAGARPPDCFQVLSPLPDALTDQNRVAEKLRRDQTRLYALVEYANTPADERQTFLRNYFA